MIIKQYIRDFERLGFGLFVHYGLYSVLGKGEWAEELLSIPREQYEREMTAQFSPQPDWAQQLAQAAKNAGCRYITLTVRHHDGFSLYDAGNLTDFDAPHVCGRDLAQEFVDACRDAGLVPFFYHTLLDWHEPTYRADFPAYLRYLRQSVERLCTRYGKIGGIWFDGWWDQDINPSFDWRLPEQYALIHKLQPSCLIGNNHHSQPFDGEDFQMFERDLPGENTAGLSGQAISKLPLETCETMNGMWGYKITDQNYKSTKTLIHYLVNAAGRNANLLMNIGPQPDGCLPEVAVQRLKEMGEWMKVYGETIYGTRGGLVAPHDWGVTTQKDNRLFVHILNLQDRSLFLPIGSKKIRKAVDFATRKAVKTQKCDGGVLISLDEVPTDVDKVIEIQL